MMAAMKTVYSVKPLADARWTVEKKGALRRSAVMDTKKDALRRAKELALADRAGGGAVIRVHDDGGKLEEQLEYDPDGKLKKD
jgi:hypothetical protein